MESYIFGGQRDDAPLAAADVRAHRLPLTAMVSIRVPCADKLSLIAMSYFN
jgi:hypothetical protein